MVCICLLDTRDFLCSSTKLSSYWGCTRVLRDEGKCYSAFQSLWFPSLSHAIPEFSKSPLKGGKLATFWVLQVSIQSICLPKSLLISFSSSPQLETSNHFLPTRGQLVAISCHGKIPPNLEFSSSSSQGIHATLP